VVSIEEGIAHEFEIVVMHLLQITLSFSQWIPLSLLCVFVLFFGHQMIASGWQQSRLLAP